MVKIKRKTRKKKEELPAIFDLGSNTLTDEYRQALTLMEFTKKNIYITGRAGTGKSTLLRHFCANTSKRFVVLAPTGVAAINVQGTTLNSFFHLPYGVLETHDVKYLLRKKEIFMNLDVIIIDEISMVRSDMMNAIDASLRLNTGRNIPFGGVQIIMFGDLYQLPPVAKRDELEYLNHLYGGIYFFNAGVFKKSGLEKIQLTQIFRQKEEKFKDLLNKIRENMASEDDLSYLSQRLCVYDGNNGPAIILAAYNNEVASVNALKLGEIKNQELVYKGSVTGEFKESDYPAEKDLKLKVGAQVMLTKNDSSGLKRWVNGTLGVVKEMAEDYTIITIGKEDHKVVRETWEVLDYRYEDKKIQKTIKGTYVQFPLKLAWAVTIHKSQGKTFDRVIIDLGRGAFAHGQTYVALSRCTSFEGVYLKSPVKFSDIKVDKKIVEFHAA